MDFTVFRGNWVDLLLIAMLLVYFIKGYRRGFLVELIDLAGFIIAFLSSLRIYSIAGFYLNRYFFLSRGIANALGFLTVGLLAEIIFSVLISIFFSKVPRILISSLAAKISGLVPAFFNWLIFTAFLLSLFVVMPIKGAVKSTILSSKIAAPILAQTQGVEGRLKSIFGGAINETLTFLTVKPEGTESVDLQFKVPGNEMKIDKAAEERMLALVNKERASRGLNVLVMDEEIRQVARDYSREMFERGYFSHYTPEGLSAFDRMTSAGISFLAAGENLAFAPNVELAHTGLMNSPGHRANILAEDFGRIGIGVIDGGVYGQMYTQNFAD